MAVRIRKTGTVLASFPSAQQVDISHVNDSVRPGDGTNLLGPLQNVGGTLCFPVAVLSMTGGGDASAANQTSGNAKTQITDSGITDVAEIDTVGAEKALKVSVISTVGGAAGPSAVDDAPFNIATDSVGVCGGIADEVGTDSVNEGDAGALRMTLDRMLYVKIGADGASLATSAKQDTAQTSLSAILVDTTAIKTATQLIDDAIFVDDAAFTPAVSKIMVMGAQADDAATDSVDEGDAGALRMTVDRQLVVKVASQSADLATQTTLALMKTALDSLLTSSQLIDDMIIATGAAVPAKISFVGGTDGTNARALKTDASGELQIDVLTLPALPAGGNNIGDVDVLSVIAAAATNKADIGLINAVTPLMGGGNTGTGSLRVTIATDNATNTNPWNVQGPAAIDAAIVGNPVIQGGSARLTTLPALVSTALDVVSMACDGYGRQLTAGSFPAGAVAYQAPSAITGTTETTIVTLDANNCLDIIWMSITNNSDVQSIASLRDATAGTVRGIFLVPARGGIVFAPPTPFAQTTKNNNWTLQMTTTATSTNCMVYFGKRPT